MSELKIQYLGQSGFHLMTEDSTLLIDPRDTKSGDLDGDILYCTHKHTDHTGGVSTFLRRNQDAIFVANEQVLEEFPEFRDRSVIASSSESHSYGPWTLEFVKGKHGLFRGIVNLGVIVRVGDHSFGHCGDTVSFQGFAKTRLDALAIPISGGFTTSPKKALEELGKFQSSPPRLIPMHWLFRNPRAFCEKVRTRMVGTTCSVMKEGDIISL